MSGRTLTVFWCTFTIIMTSTYTANLAAFLTVSITEIPIRNLDDLVAQSEIKPIIKKGTNLISLFSVRRLGVSLS